MFNNMFGGGGIPYYIRNLEVGDRKLSNSHKLIRSANNKINSNVNFVFVGDSILDNFYNKLIEYVTSQVSQINIGVKNHALSGQSAYNFQRDIGATGITNLVSDIGDGENCIIFYNFGVNDYSISSTDADSYIEDCLDLIISSCPKAQIILLQPIASGSTTRDTYLKNVYSTLSSSKSLFEVDMFTAFDYTIQADPLYYYDATHPNIIGSRRYVNYLLTKVLPSDIYLTIHEMDNIIPSVTLPVVEKDNTFWYISTDLGVLGDETTATDWLCLEEIPVEPNFDIKVTHFGDRNDHVLVDINGDEIANIKPSEIIDGARIVSIPSNIYSVKINICSSSYRATYDALPDISIAVEYSSGNLDQYLKIEDINSGLNIRGIFNKFRDGILVDDYGKIGTSGQTLTVDVNNKMKWA